MFIKLCIPSGCSLLYCEIIPHTAIRPWILMFISTASSIFPPTFSKYISIPRGKYLAKDNALGMITEKRIMHLGSLWQTFWFDFFFTLLPTSSVQHPSMALVVESRIETELILQQLNFWYGWNGKKPRHATVYDMGNNRK